MYRATRFQSSAETISETFNDQRRESPASHQTDTNASYYRQHNGGAQPRCGSRKVQRGKPAQQSFIVPTPHRPAEHQHRTATVGGRTTSAPNSSNQRDRVSYQTDCGGSMCKDTKPQHQSFEVRQQPRLSPLELVMPTSATLRNTCKSSLESLTVCVLSIKFDASRNTDDPLSNQQRKAEPARGARTRY